MTALFSNRHQANPVEALGVGGVVGMVDGEGGVISRKGGDFGPSGVVDGGADFEAVGLVSQGREVDAGALGTEFGDAGDDEFGADEDGDGLVGGSRRGGVVGGADDEVDGTFEPRDEGE